MFKRVIISTLLIGAFLNSSFAAPDIPDPQGFVNDFANILSTETETEITELIESVKESQGAEIAVVTIDSLGDYEVNEYAVEMGRSWGIGSEERDDGVLFLTAIEDRETYIATGYGVEAYITDLQAYRITEYDVVPFFREGNYDSGILLGTQKIANALLEIEPLPKVSPLNTDLLVGVLFWLMAIFSFILPWIFAVLGRSKRWWPGGVVGGMMGTGLWHFFAISWIAIIGLSLLGFFLDYVASANYKKGRDSWWTGGGSSGWGGGSSGGFGGGGFGGFGGGSFGGGGGGSSW